MSAQGEKAAALAAIGWRVFPCKADKSPATPHGFKDSSSDASQVAAWWGERPDALIGVDADGSGLACIDLDVKNGKDGVAALRATGYEFATSGLSYTTVSGKGKHYIYADPEPASGRLRPYVDFLGLKGVDVRAGASYFVFCGDEADVEIAGDLPDAPEWLYPDPAEEAGRDVGQPFEKGLAEWAQGCADGPASFRVRSTMANLPGHGALGHTAMRDALRALVGAGAEGDSGVPDAIAQLRGRYLAGEYDTPKYRRGFEAALSGAVTRYGAFWPVGKHATHAAFEGALGEGGAESLYVDVREVLSGNLTAPVPCIGRRSDGCGLFYDRAVNTLFGAPESGKSLIASAVAADTVFSGQAVLWLDLDHNGAQATVARRRSFGVQPEVLGDRDVFRLAEPESPDQVEAIIRDMGTWAPALVVVDSVGELLGLYGASNDSADDFTRVNRMTLAAMAKSASVLAIDHEAKGTDSRAYGAGGTMAKKRAADGLYARVTRVRPFAPGQGGKAALGIVKDRHGSVRAASPAGASEPVAATFELFPIEGGSHWRFHAPAPVRPVAETDADILAGLEPEPSSIRDVRKRLGWGDTRSRRAWQDWQAIAAADVEADAA